MAGFPAAESARPAESDTPALVAAEPPRGAAGVPTPDPLPPSPAVPAVVRLHAASVHIATATMTAELVDGMVFVVMMPPPRLSRITTEIASAAPSQASLDAAVIGLPLATLAGTHDFI